MTAPVPEGWYPDPTVAIPTAAIPTAALRGAEAAKALIPHPTDDPFYSYTGTTPLADIAPGNGAGDVQRSLPPLGRADGVEGLAAALPVDQPDG